MVKRRWHVHIKIQTFRPLSFHGQEIGDGSRSWRWHVHRNVICLKPSISVKKLVKTTFFCIMWSRVSYRVQFSLTLMEVEVKSLGQHYVGKGVVKERLQKLSYISSTLSYKEFAFHKTGNRQLQCMLHFFKMHVTLWFPSNNLYHGVRQGTDRWMH
jgi:hypothetical protein